MSGLYNEVFGIHPLAGILLEQILVVDPQTLPRFRDCYPAQYGEGELVIELVTRAGGNNASAYPEEIAELEAHPLYRGSNDDPFDRTYRVFHFWLPTTGHEAYMAMHRLLEEVPEAIIRVPLGERWQAAFAALKQRGTPE